MNDYSIENNNLKNWFNVVAALTLLFNALNPHLAKAASTTPKNNKKTEITLSESPAGRMFKPVKPDRVIKATITAYTSTPDQTDSSPFIAASGKRVYFGMIAANGLPFGTSIKIPSLYGDKVFKVEDRMNSRYGYGRMDVWLDTTKKEARKFGVKRVPVEIYLPN